MLSALRPAPITLDDASNAGEGTLELQNTGGDKVEGLLCAGEFKSETSKRRLAAWVTFARVDRVAAEAPAAEKTAKAEKEAAAPENGQASPSSCQLLSLSCGERLSLIVKVSGAWDAGEASAPLLLDGKAVRAAEAGKDVELVARKMSVPFNVKVANPGDRTTPTDTFLDDKLTLVLQNDDSLTYPAKWRLLVGGAHVAPIGPNGERDAASITLVPGANPLAIELPQEIFFERFKGLFRPKVVEAKLWLEYDSQAGPTLGSPRQIDLVLGLYRHSKDTTEIWCLGMSFLLLLVGGCASLLANYGIPNALRRSALLRDLELLASRTKRLSGHVSSALRVELQAQPQQLRGRVLKVFFFLPGAADTYDEVAREIDLLGRRVALACDVDDRLMRIERLGVTGPPEFLHSQKRLLKGCLRVAASQNSTDAAFNSAEATLAGVSEKLDKVEALDAELCNKVREDAKAFWTEHFEPAWAALPTDTAWVMKLREAMGGFVEHAKRCFAAGHEAEATLATVDAALAKSKIILEYARVCESATKEKAAYFDEKGLIDKDGTEGHPPSQRERFFQCLSGVGMRALDEARALLREAEQGIYVKQVVEQIERGKFKLTYLPTSIAVYDPVAFDVDFYEDKFNEAVAKDKLNCTWTFKDIPLNASGSRPAPSAQGQPSMESCWSPTQFFESEGTKLVSVEIKNGPYLHSPKPSADHAADTAALQLRVVVQNPRKRGLSRRAWVEVLQLGLALIVTMGALVIGARDQIQKLDLLPAFLAILALGFGADTVKNILARQHGGEKAVPAR